MNKSSNTKSKNFTLEQARNFRITTKSLAVQASNAAVDLARALHRIYYGEVETKGAWLPCYVIWGFDTFHDYAEHELGMHGWTARRYVRVYEELIDSPNADIKNEHLPNSITKLMLLSRVSRMEPTRLVQYVRDSNRLSCCALEAKINREFTKQITYRSVSFHMRSSSVRTLMVRLRRHMAQTGIKTYGAALVSLVQQGEAAAPLRLVKKTG